MIIPGYNDTLYNRILDSLRYTKVWNAYYSVKDFFFPKQRWIKKYVQWNSYYDKDGIIEDFLLGTVIEFVESELGGRESLLQEIDYYTDDKFAEAVSFRAGLLSAYDFAKEREGLIKALDKALLLDHENYDDMESGLIEETSYHLKWIVENREKLWT